MQKLAIALTTTFVALCAACNEATPRDSAANVLLITLDTTRADHIGAYGARNAATPALDALAAEGTRFARAVTSTPLTLPAHTSIHSGTWPLDHGVRDNVGFLVAPDTTTLAEALRDAGLATGAILGAFVLQRAWGLGQGFDVYDDTFEGIDPGTTLSAVEVQRGADQVVDRGLDWIAGLPSGQRFFAWLHFYDAHYPYEPPGEFGARFADRLYAGEIAWVDSQIARLFAELRRRGLWDRTLVVVIGDHGEALGEHGEPDHGIFVYDGTMRVPLLVRAPGGHYRGTVERLVRDIDVMPTILDYLSLPVPPGVRGESLLPAMAGRGGDPAGEAYGEAFYGRFHYGWSELRSLRNERYKYIRAPREELYDLDRDPGETANIAGQYPEIVAELSGRLDRLLDRAGGPQVATPADMDPDALARLRSLGYVGAVVRTADVDLADPKDKADALPMFSRVGYWGTRYLHEGRFADALALADEALAIEPDYLDAHQLKASALLGLSRPTEAKAVLESALRLNPDDLGTLFDLARCHRAAGDPETALDLLARIRALSPGYAAGYLTAAELLVEAERPAEALEVLRALVGVHPDAALGHYEIGRILLAGGDLEGARRSIETAAGLRDLRGARYNLALIAEEQGDQVRAEREYRGELERFPRNHEAWINLGLLLMQQGDAASGAEAFLRATEAAPRLPAAWILLARARLTLGARRDEVLPLVRKALALDPTSAPARALAAELEGH